MNFAPRPVQVGPADQLWGPQLVSYFDFTLLFEQSMFSILPSCMLLGATPIQIGHLLRGQPRVRPGLLLWAKLVFALVLVACHAAAIYIWTAPPYYTQISVVASIFSLLSGICIGALLCVEHIYIITPSALVSL